jgi:hypothetical protein
MGLLPTGSPVPRLNAEIGRSAESRLQRALQAAFFAEDFFTTVLGCSIVTSVRVCDFAKIAANSSSFQFGSLRSLQHPKLGLERSMVCTMRVWRLPDI